PTPTLTAPPPTPAATAAASATPETPAPTPTVPPPTAAPAATAAPLQRVFTLALPAEPASLDPAAAEDEASLLVVRHLYEGLTAFEPGTTRVRPALAESWTASAGGQLWTFKLRAGLTFSDGTPLTAEAARLNFERWRTRQAGGRYTFWRLMFGGFAGQTDEAGAPLSLVAVVTATTPSTLVLRLTRPDAALPNTLAMPAFGLVNPAAWETPGFGQAGAPSAGAGPFRRARWANGVVQVERNPAYWATPARPDGLLFKSIPDDVQRVLALQVGEVDGLARLPATDYDLAERWPSLRVEFDPPLEVLYLGFNQAHAPWGDVNCRLAVASAVDPARYARDFFPGDAQPATALQPPSVWGYAAPAASRPPDPAQARALWEACLAQQTPPEAITLYVPPVPRAYLPDPAGLGAALQADLAAAGISVTVQSPDWATAWLPDVQAGRADLFLLGWAGLNGDPDAYLCPLFCGANAAFNSDPAGLPRPPDEALAGLLREAQGALDPAERLALYAQAQTLIFEQVPALPLTYRSSAWAFRADLTGHVPSPIESVFTELSLR
ncbi:MAG: hypothetical protein JNK29_01700, partial [Anaerolineales bacterium]|nr:hypothetical protein [Anaerolineales bacterium]